MSGTASETCVASSTTLSLRQSLLKSLTLVCSFLDRPFSLKHSLPSTASDAYAAYGFLTRLSPRYNSIADVAFSIDLRNNVLLRLLQVFCLLQRLIGV